MKKMPVFVAMGCVGVAAASIHAQSAPPAAQGQIGKVMADMARAAHAHDTKAFMSGYNHGPDLVFEIDGRVIRGWDALDAQQLRWWRNGNSDVVYTETAPVKFMQLAPDVWVTTEQLSSRRAGPDGTVAVGIFAVTSIWRKYAIGWRIAYGHESWKKPPG